MTNFPKSESFDTSIVREKTMEPNPLKLAEELLASHAVPGMRKDCHDCLPPELLVSWTPEQLNYMHDTSWWRTLVSQTPSVEIVDMREMTCHEEAWQDWLTCENEYAQGDACAWEAGAGQYLNSIAITLRKA